MSGLLIFIRLHPGCAAPGAGETVAVEIDPSGCISDVIEELTRMSAIKGGVKIEFRGEALKPEDMLADVGLCPQSTALAVPLSEGVCTMACGLFHGVVLLPGGVVECWGSDCNTDGEETGQAKPPERLTQGGVVEVDAGDNHNVARLDNGEVVCWGENTEGQCDVPLLRSPAVRVAAGGQHTAALLSCGEVKCWGANEKGQCDTPDFDAPVCEVAVGGTFTGARLDTGRVVLWGEHLEDEGELHVFDGDSRPKAVRIVAGDAHFAAMYEDGTVTSCGRDNDGQCAGVNALEQVRQVALGGFHSVALLEDGTVECFGQDYSNQCTVPPLPLPVVLVAAGYSHSCAKLEDGSLICWGDNGMGECEVPPSLRPIGVGTDEKEKEEAVQGSEQG
eukprot:Hpha_TRINITY_DN15493_c0_g1::TRINITY_DN15493_c0_g1_i2::g.173642::m.173642